MPTPIRVRMYRPGFGDCFLISFGSDSSTRHVLIDFGAHMHGEIGTMDQIMDDLEKTSGSRLELIVATHAHRDHISGFGKFANRFANFKIGEVWLPWTDNPRDKHAAKLKKKHLALYDALDRHLRLAVNAQPANPTCAAALEALSNLKGNETATSELARGFGTGANVRYFKSGVAIDKVVDISGLSAEIFGPPKDVAFLSRMNPPADQHFLSAADGTAASLQPFPNLEIRATEPDYVAIVNEGQPVVTQEDLTLLHDVAEARAERLALALDSIRNNTSLVILFRYRGKSLLFPGDAQWGNWQSWIGTDKARQLLSELDFLKVAHHGSENATPVDVVRALKASALAVMVPTQIKPFPTIPRMPLLRELEKHCEGNVAVRSDWIAVEDAPAGPMPSPVLPKGFSPGEIWIDYDF
jgi:beta-lactamase superfamily II metal-dependent hydrolase